MADLAAPTYGYHDVSAYTSLLVCGHRTLGARGTLIHTTSGANSLEWLQTGSAITGTPASADILIDRRGTRFDITPHGRYAYHAGKSSFTLDREYRGDEVSQILRGIELECLDSQSPTPEQIDSLAEQMVEDAITNLWRWPLLYTGHYAVARPLGRRSDPVNFPWGDLAGRIYIHALAANLPGLLP